MKNQKILFILFSICCLSISCIKEELASSEADIVGFDLPGIQWVEKNINTNEIYIKLEHNDLNALKHIAPQISLSYGARLSPESGEYVDLNSVIYTVTSQNGKFQKQYTLKIAQEYVSDTILFSFDDWKVSAENYDYLTDADWSSGNAGVSMGLAGLGIEKKPENYPTQMTGEGFEGKAVKLETKKGGVIFGIVKVPIWAGNCFLGNFNTAKTLVNTLEATEFGRIYKRKPKFIEGYYHYHEGSGLFDYNGTPDPIRRDSCDIYAVFYKVNSYEETLTAYDIQNSPKIISRTEKFNGVETAGNDFHHFKLNFTDYKEEPDFENQNCFYKLTLVFSSSKDGGIPMKDEKGKNYVLYAGKVGSTLIVDQVRIVNE